jgi:serine/threonine protein kinase
MWVVFDEWVRVGTSFPYRRPTLRVGHYEVSHPNVCLVYDLGEIEGSPYISMECVDGEDLGSVLRRIGRLPGDKGVAIARKLCAGLAAAHAPAPVPSC